LRGVFFMPVESLATIKRRIADACARSGRAPDDVLLVGASKTVSATRLLEFQAAGLANFGENYVQDALEKIGEFRAAGVIAHWHFIGALQSNKAKVAVREFELIHSVDRLGLARELNREAARAGKIQRVLLQINLGGESTKAGASETEAPSLLEACLGMANLEVRGLMSLPPFEEDVEAMRPYHRRLREIRDQLRCQYSLAPDRFAWLSMGMSHDFEIAIEEGATHVRIGTALFGTRV